MARLIQVFSRVVVLAVKPPAFFSSCRFASRSGGAPWLSGRTSNSASVYDEGMSGEDPVLEDVDDKLQALVEWVLKTVNNKRGVVFILTHSTVSREGRKRRKTVKFHMLRRQMTQPGAPQRKLTWSAIEQIRWVALHVTHHLFSNKCLNDSQLKSSPSIWRYLKEEQPEEWTVQRLAEGFSVTPDVIRRVLRSKFVPPPARKDKQDAKIYAEPGQRALGSGARTTEDRLKLTGNHTPAALLPGPKDAAVKPVARQALILQDQSGGSLAPAVLAAPNAQITGKMGRDTSAATSKQEDTISDIELSHKQEERWDGRVWTEEELEEFLEMKNTKVVQAGKDFYDAEGNFLYRITWPEFKGVSHVSWKKKKTSVSLFTVFVTRCQYSLSWN